MPEFIKGRDLCRSFFFEIAKHILEKNFPELRYTAALLGYGSDVLGYDDPVSTDHMWGPRFYLFLSETDIGYSDAVPDRFSREFPVSYRGYSVNFSNPEENGVCSPEAVTEGPVRPLVFIYTIDGFLKNELGTASFDRLTAADWLSFPEHKLLSFRLADIYVDGLGLAEKLRLIRFYPEPVRNFLLASDWALISEEQAFVRRTADVGDETGSALIAGRIAERIMRLCFLYQGEYAPYSKWFGSAFSALNIDKEIKSAIFRMTNAQNAEDREKAYISALCAAADMHNASGITQPVRYEVEKYYSREIPVIYAEKFSDALTELLRGTELENAPLIGTFSELGGGFCRFFNDTAYFERIRDLYR